MSRSVDLDQLADFVGGALDGTPNADDVRHLITTDTAWATAYAALTTADAAVRTQLSALGAVDEIMPADVAARLERAMRNQPPGASAAPADRTVVRLDDVRRRRRRFTIALSTAAAVVAVGFASIVVVPLMAGESTKTTSSQVDAAAGAAPTGDIVLLTTGTNYRPETLGAVRQPYSASGLADSRANKQSAPREGVSAFAGRPESAPDVPSALTRLADPASRATCIATIVAAYGGRVTLIDFAAFQGEPAALVLVDGAALAGAGRTLAVVVAGDCGQDGVTSAELYHGVV